MSKVEVLCKGRGWFRCAGVCADLGLKKCPCASCKLSLSQWKHSGSAPELTFPKTVKQMSTQTHCGSLSQSWGTLPLKCRNLFPNCKYFPVYARGQRSEHFQITAATSDLWVHLRPAEKKHFWMHNTDLEDGWHTHAQTAKLGLQRHLLEKTQITSMKSISESLRILFKTQYCGSGLSTQNK